jgi:hypothetical protein
VLTVMLGVMTAGFDVMMLGMAGMTVGAVGVVRSLVMVACLVMPGGFAVVLRRVLMMLGGLVMVLDACVVAHGALPVGCESLHGLRSAADNLLTAARQLCCG